MATEDRPVEIEQARWQDAIYQLLRKECGDSIDGGGCDSGDPLDFTLSEISQAIAIFKSAPEVTGGAEGLSGIPADLQITYMAGFLNEDPTCVLKRQLIERIGKAEAALAKAQEERDQFAATLSDIQSDIAEVVERWKTAEVELATLRAEAYADGRV